MDKNKKQTQNNVYIRCPRCELNYILKKDKICGVCKKELDTASKHEDDFENELDLNLDICPVCKINYIREDEECCEECVKENAHSKRLLNEDEGESWEEEGDEEDLGKTSDDDELGPMVGITDLGEEDDIEISELDLDIDIDDEDMDFEDDEEIEINDDEDDFDDDDLDDDFEDGGDDDDEDDDDDDEL